MISVTDVASIPLGATDFFCKNNQFYLGRLGLTKELDGKHDTLLPTIYDVIPGLLVTVPFV